MVKVSLQDRAHCEGMLKIKWGFPARHGGTPDGFCSGTHLEMDDGDDGLGVALFWETPKMTYLRK